MKANPDVFPSPGLVPSRKKEGKEVPPASVPPLPDVTKCCPGSVKPRTQGNQFLETYLVLRGGGSRGARTFQCRRIKQCLLEQRCLKPERAESGPGTNTPLTAHLLSMSPHCFGPWCHSPNHFPPPPANGPVLLLGIKLPGPWARQSSLPRGLRDPSSPECSSAGQLTWRRR